MQTATESIDPRLMQQRLGDLGSEIAAFAAREQELIKRKAEQQSLVRREFATVRLESSPPHSPNFLRTSNIKSPSGFS